MIQNQCEMSLYCNSDSPLNSTLAKSFIYFLCFLKTHFLQTSRNEEIPGRTQILQILFFLTSDHLRWLQSNRQKFGAKRRDENGRFR